MTELFEMILHAPESDKHYISATIGRIKGKAYMTVYVHKCDERGISVALDDCFSTFLEEDVKARLKCWIDRITEEAKHDDKGTG